ncbi:MAG: glycosyltransferase [Rhizobiaceae bacterium]
MLSVIIETRDCEEALARTLASLVGAVVEGAVRDVIIVDLGSTDSTLKVAEHAGCALSASLSEALAQAKCDWLILIEPGARLSDGWTDSAIAHAARHAQPAHFTRTRASRPGLFSRVFNTALASGFLMSKKQALTRLRQNSHAEDLARGLSSKTLDGEIAAAPKR